jgi:uncharacterized protein (TIGR03067 family)
VSRFAPLIAVLLIPPAPAAPVPKSLRKAAPDTIVGEWREVKAAADGKPTDTHTGYTWRFDADGTAAVVWPNGTVIPAAYKLDDQTAPTGYDWTLTSGNHQFVGVCEVNGDVLRTATVSAGKPRPTALAAGPGVEYRTYVRVKAGSP